MPDNIELLKTIGIFRMALCWKAYWTRQITPYIGGRVLEVGAGFGDNTPNLIEASRGSSWCCLEPDPEAFAELSRNLPAGAEAMKGDLGALGSCESFDTLLYIDVLEHIADDRTELLRAGNVLAPGGHLIVLSPAHPWLFTPFDTAIGHYRRYTRTSLLAVAPPGCTVVRARYLDSAGLLASAGNRLLLRQAQPDPRQLLFWDRVLVRISRVTDPLFAYCLGKSILVVWKKT